MPNKEEVQRFLEGLFIDSWVVTLIPIILFFILGFVYNIKFTSALNEHNVFAEPMWDTMSTVFFTLSGVFCAIIGVIGNETVEFRKKYLRKQYDEEQKQKIALYT